VVVAESKLLLIGGCYSFAVCHLVWLMTMRPVLLVGSACVTHDRADCVLSALWSIGSRCSTVIQRLSKCVSRRPGVGVVPGTLPISRAWCGAWPPPPLLLRISWRDDSPLPVDWLLFQSWFCRLGLRVSRLISDSSCSPMMTVHAVDADSDHWCFTNLICYSPSSRPPHSA